MSTNTEPQWFLPVMALDAGYSASKQMNDRITQGYFVSYPWVQNQIVFEKDTDTMTGDGDGI